jgi:hypothetical protein
MTPFETQPHHQPFKSKAAQQERDFLQLKVDKLVEDLKSCAQEKFDLEAECERLVGSTASLVAEAKHADQDLAIHRNALRALEESVTSSLAESKDDNFGAMNRGNKLFSTVLARSLASSRLAESSALQKLQKLSHN